MPWRVLCDYDEIPENPHHACIHQSYILLGYKWVVIGLTSPITPPEVEHLYSLQRYDVEYELYLYE